MYVRILLKHIFIIKNALNFSDCKDFFLLNKKAEDDFRIFEKLV